MKQVSIVVRPKFCYVDILLCSKLANLLNNGIHSTIVSYVRRLRTHVTYREPLYTR